MMDDTSDVSAQEDSADRQSAGRVAQRDGTQAPMVRGGLNPEKVNRLAEGVSMAVQALSHGEAKPSIGTVTDRVEQLPPDIFSPLVALSGFIQAAGKEVKPLASYTFDPMEVASSDAGLDEGWAALSEMSQDKDVISAMKQAGVKHEPDKEPAADEEEPEEEPAAEEDDGMMPPKKKA